MIKDFGPKTPFMISPLQWLIDIESKLDAQPALVMMWMLTVQSLFWRAEARQTINSSACKIATMARLVMPALAPQ